MNRIKQLRDEKKINQTELGKVIGVTSQAMGMYENEKRGLDTKTASILADFFNVSVDYLLGKTDIRNIEQEFKFAYHKEMEGLTEEEIADALRFYKKIKYGEDK